MLIPFKHSDYYRNFFKTTVKTAKGRYDSFGISLEKIEQKIATLLEVEYKSLKKFRETGVDDLLDDEDTLSIEGRLEYAPEDIGPEIPNVYDILIRLENSRNAEIVKLDVKEIKLMMGKDWPKNVSEIFQDAEEEYLKSISRVNLLEDFKGHDFFICHDSRDKKTFVEPLAKALKKKRINPWYDKFVLKAGDSLIGKIDDGLKLSKFGIVVLSKNFISNTKWPKDEFISLRTRELHSGKKLIIPIWRKNIKKSDVIKYNLELADRFALQEKNGIKSIVRDLEVKLRT